MKYFKRTAKILSLSLPVFALVCSTGRASAAELEYAEGPFKPTWESLQSQYKTPEWFRDAKFGIWAHWGPQCEPEHGDWYARKMYQEGSGDYKSHVAEYGHPSTNGFKDVIYSWKAAQFNPDQLLHFYANCGAKYFMALANHHDNFDLYDSKFQPWNSVAVGPKQDLIGAWAAAARKARMRFAVSVHASHAWSWYEVAQGADTNGPLQGVPYDGKLTKADGKGLWWDGLDPQDLYAQNHAPGKKLDWEWNPARGSSVPDQAYLEKFYRRTKQLMDDYHPDQIYFDDAVLPMHGVTDEVGLKLAAHFYNSSVAKNGANDVVMNTKKLNPGQRRAFVYDIERGKAEGILPEPWQTDTCIGQWHYNREVFEKHQYKTAAVIVPMLADIVSKNGNLMLSVPLRRDGTLDDDESKILADIGAWFRVNGNAIYETRPWKIYGEGPSTIETEKGRFDGQSDTQKKPFIPEDIRFTQSKDGRTLYAIVLAWPENGEVIIKSLAANLPHWPAKVGNVNLLGTNSKTYLTVRRADDGLHVTLPKNKPWTASMAFALKIEL